MDYSKITADPVRGPEIGRMYVEASPFVTTLARVAYRAFADQVIRQYRGLPIRVELQTENPYESAQEMFKDISRNARLKIYRTVESECSPLLSLAENDMFRAVHDFHGHYMTGRDFSRHGEEAAWVRHSQMFTGLARRAMTSETRGQNSAFIWINGGETFPVQKAILLPNWVSDIPERWVG